MKRERSRIVGLCGISLLRTRKSNMWSSLSWKHWSTQWSTRWRWSWTLGQTGRSFCCLHKLVSRLQSSVISRQHTVPTNRQMNTMSTNTGKVSVQCQLSFFGPSDLVANHVTRTWRTASVTQWIILCSVRFWKWTMTPTIESSAPVSAMAFSSKLKRLLNEWGWQCKFALLFLETISVSLELCVKPC